MADNQTPTVEQPAYKRTASVEELAYKIKGTDSPPNPRFAFFLGAGASFQSNIATARDMIEDFKQSIFAVEIPDPSKKEKEREQWLVSQSWYDHKNPYSSLFERVEPKEMGRQRYIEHMIEGKTPSFGYVILAYLMAQNYVNTIITTNFDDLVSDACATFTSVHPIVFAYGTLAEDMRYSAKRPKILKVHGDYLYSALKNIGTETRKQDPNMARHVLQLLTEYGLIVVGYSGRDESVMKILHRMSEKNDLYWCIHHGDKLDPSVIRLLDAKNGFLVETQGFDEMMNTIRGIVDFDYQAIADPTPRYQLLVSSVFNFDAQYRTQVVLPKSK